MKLQRIFIYLLLLGTFSALIAQPRFNPEKRVKELKKELKLTEEQQSAILNILEEAKSEMMNIKDEAGGDRMAMREEMRELMQSTDKNIEAILTDEQIVKYNELKKEERSRRKNNRKRNN